MKEGSLILKPFFSQVNDVDFGHFTREEAANFLLNIRKGEPVQVRTQHKMDSKLKNGDDEPRKPRSGLTFPSAQFTRRS